MSHHSAEQLSSNDTSNTSNAAPKRFRIHHIAQAKAAGKPLTMLTAYDALTAPLLEASGVDMLLVGDSLGNVMLGFDSTLQVTMDDMLRATSAVARSTNRVLLIADMPFGSYEGDPQIALENAVRLIRAGAHAVKLEGGAVRADTVRCITAAGIPVIGHLGYTPQSENALGGPRMQGRGEDAVERLKSDAFALQDAGVSAIVLEMVPALVAADLTDELDVATIGIGAGPAPDGQVLVWSDMAGMGEWAPSFVKRFASVGQEITAAASAYVNEVQSRAFPGPENYKRN